MTIPIIALTAGATVDEIQAALNSGCTRFISKPVNGSELIEAVWKLTATQSSTNCVEWPET